MDNAAWAGHAGDAGGSVLFPPELTGSLALISLLLAALVVLGLVALWLLVRIDRRLKSLHKGPSSPK